MKFRIIVLVSAFIAAMTLISCGHKGGGDSTPAPTPTPNPPQDTTVAATPGTVINSPSPSPVTSFTQNIRAADGGIEAFPLQANVWTLTQDFALVNEQFQQKALAMKVGVTPFPDDQHYSELAFYTPVMGAAEGVRIADTIDDTSTSTGFAPLADPDPNVATQRSAILNATSDSRLQQTVDLTTALSGTAIIVSWDDEVTLEEGSILGYAPGFRVVVRNADGTELRQLFSVVLANAYTGASHSFDISEFRGQKIVLSFELHSSRDVFGLAHALVDNVSVIDNNGIGTNHVSNGGFQGGMVNWTSNAPAEVSNLTSGVRNLEGLNVKRSFYTVPNNLWGRWVDVFENTTATPVTKTVTYETALGAGPAAIIYQSLSETATRALTAWDGSHVVRDAGLVFGSATTTGYKSASALNGTDGKDIVTVTYDITVPANGRTAIVSFVIMNGRSTGLAAGATVATKASEIDSEVFKIVTQFWTDPKYRTGMTQEQMDAISNFPKPAAQ